MLVKTIRCRHPQHTKNLQKHHYTNVRLIIVPLIRDYFVYKYLHNDKLKEILLQYRYTLLFNVNIQSVASHSMNV